jgi:hypothetical protein
MGLCNAQTPFKALGVKKTENRTVGIQVRRPLICDAQEFIEFVK